MKIEEMEAGPEMDALVAEQVMGWHWGEAEDGVATWTHTDSGIAWAVAEPTFSPSTNIADAWQVVEKLIGLGYWISLSHNGNQHAACWDFRLCDRATESKREIAIEATAPLAICRAALKAVEAAG